MSVFIKICGLVSTDDAILINRFPVTFAGIVLFYPKSRRNRTLPEARSILEALRPDIKRVAVVVSPSVAEIAEIEKLDTRQAVRQSAARGKSADPKSV